MRFVPSKSGLLICSANNSMGRTKNITYIFLSDISEPFVISGHEKKIAVGDRVELECATDIYEFDQRITWFNPSNKPIKRSKNINVAVKYSTYSRKRIITFENISKSDAGTYRCSAVEKINLYVETKDVFIEVYDAEPPKITSSIFGSTIRRLSREMLVLKCRASGLPIPDYTWYKDDEIIAVNDSLALNETQNMKILKDKSTLEFDSLQPEDAGTYKCIATNRIGMDEKTVQVQVEGELRNS